MKAMQTFARTTSLSRSICARHSIFNTTQAQFPALTLYKDQHQRLQRQTTTATTLSNARSFQTKSKSDHSVAEATAYSTRPLNNDLFSLDYRSGTKQTSSLDEVKSKRRGRGPARKKSIETESPFYRPPSTATNTSWSSPHDNVARQSYMKSYSHLWTLLEACLDTQNFIRAQDVLISFSTHSAPKDVTVAVNNYLLRLAEVNKNDASVAQNWLTSISAKLPQFTADSVTDAIILRNVCLATDYDKNSILDLFSNALGRDMLKHVDVLGIEMISKIIKVGFFYQYRKIYFFLFLTLLDL